MSLPYLPDGHVGFVPRPSGFGARLLGIDPTRARTDAGDMIVATRQERDLLRGDLTVLGADGTLLPEALGCRVDVTAAGDWRVAGGSTADAADWEDLELGEPEEHPALRTALAVLDALAPEGPVGVVLTGPVALASCVAGGPVGAGEDDELIDVCAIAVCDAAKAVVERGGHVVLEERRAPTAEELALCSPLLNLLAHHRRPALVVVHDDERGAFATPPAAIGGVVGRSAAPAWGAEWPTHPEPPAFAPAIAPDASPERVQELTRQRAATA